MSQNRFCPQVGAFDYPFFFFSNRADASVFYVSPSIQKVLGYRPSEIVGRRYTEFLDPECGLNRDIPAARQKRFVGDGHHLSLRSVTARTGEKRILRIQTYGQLDQDNQVVANHALAEDVTDKLDPGLVERYDELINIERQLSERERTVLHHVVTGSTNRRIANLLDVSDRTVELTRARLMRKFSVRSAAELVASATELSTLRRFLSDYDRQIEQQPSCSA